MFIRLKQSRLTLLVLLFAAFVVPAAVYAADGFTDVPDDNVFHDDIAWLADAGVTKGCNPPANTEFCPGSNVTREQMAAFMHRFAQYLGASDGVVAEADTVAGLTPAGVAQVFGSELSASETLVVDTNHALSTIDIAVETDGYLANTGAISFRDTDDARFLTWLQLDEAVCSNFITVVDSIGFAYASTTSTAEYSSATPVGMIPVPAGDHTLTLCVREFGAGTDPLIVGGDLQAVFTASGSTTPAPSPSTTPAGVLPGTEG